MDAGPENRSFSGFVFFRSLPGWCVCACVKGPGEARHDIAAAPGPLNRFRLLPLQVPPRRSSTPRRAPKSQKPFSQLAVQFEFRSFPRFPKTQKAQQGLRTASWGVVFRDFGFNSKPQPHRRVGINRFPGGRPHRDPCSGLACQSSRSRICTPDGDRKIV